MEAGPGKDDLPPEGGAPTPVTLETIAGEVALKRDLSPEVAAQLKRVATSPVPIFANDEAIAALGPQEAAALNTALHDVYIKAPFDLPADHVQITQQALDAARQAGVGPFTGYAQAHELTPEAQAVFQRINDGEILHAQNIALSPEETAALTANLKLEQNRLKAIGGDLGLIEHVGTSHDILHSAQIAGVGPFAGTVELEPLSAHAQSIFDKAKTGDAATIDYDDINKLSAREGRHLIDRLEHETHVARATGEEALLRHAAAYKDVLSEAEGRAAGIFALEPAVKEAAQKVVEGNMLLATPEGFGALTHEQAGELAHLLKQNRFSIAQKIGGDYQDFDPQAIQQTHHNLELAREHGVGPFAARTVEAPALTQAGKDLVNGLKSGEIEHFGHEAFVGLDHQELAKVASTLEHEAAVAYLTGHPKEAWEHASNVARNLSHQLESGFLPRMAIPGHIAIPVLGKLDSAVSRAAHDIAAGETMYANHPALEGFTAEQGKQLQQALERIKILDGPEVVHGMPEFIYPHAIDSSLAALHAAERAGVGPFSGTVELPIMHGKVTPVFNGIVDGNITHVGHRSFKKLNAEDAAFLEKRVRQHADQSLAFGEHELADQCFTVANRLHSARQAGVGPFGAAVEPLKLPRHVRKLVDKVGKGKITIDHPSLATLAPADKELFEQAVERKYFAAHAVGDSQKATHFDNMCSAWIDAKHGHTGPFTEEALAVAAAPRKTFLQKLGFGRNRTASPEIPAARVIEISELPPVGPVLGQQAAEATVAREAEEVVKRGAKFGKAGLAIAGGLVGLGALAYGLSGSKKEKWQDRIRSADSATGRQV